LVAATKLVVPMESGRFVVGFLGKADEERIPTFVGIGAFLAATTTVKHFGVKRRPIEVGL